VYSRERLGDLLLKSGVISADQLQSALDVQNRTGGKLGEVLVQQLLVTEEQLARALAEQKGLEFVNLTSIILDRAVVTRLPERIARKKRVIPIDLRDGSIVVAMADPLDVEAIDDVQLRTGMPVIPVVAPATQIDYAIDKYIASPDVFQEVRDSLEAQGAEETPEVTSPEDDVPVVRLVNQLIREAVADGASDLHIEPGEKALRVRYRVDGVLHDVTSLPVAIKAGVISRVKIMAEMNIAERRRPQDGRILLSMNGRPVDLRVATLPTPFGESVVIRVLNHELSFRTLEDLGMSEEHLVQFERMVAKPWGAILVAGPTGSGKSTSLYAALQRLNTEERKIITVEDPIEYQMGGVTQIAVNPGIGLTFSAGLRTILRSDPDIVMIGEMRDPETAEIGIRAALTGHLVLSSIHTNDAPSALTRLVDMGIAPYITSSALAGVVAQRLARKLCQHCKQPLAMPRETLLTAGYTEEEVDRVQVFGPVGCPECFGGGYRGRVGLFEVMSIDEEIVRLYLQDAASDQIRAAAIAHGMRPLRRDALDKVAAGVTSLEEIERVVV